MTFNLAPDTFTAEVFTQVIAPCVQAAEGLGMVLAAADLDAGWDSSTFFEHDAADCIISGAVDALKTHAKNNQLFYNTEKLLMAVNQALIEAYARGFVANRPNTDEPARCSVA